MVRLGEGPPALLLADHLEGERPVLVYRVPDLAAAKAGLGAEDAAEFGIPPGSCCELETPAGQRIAIYEATRPHVLDSFEGRRDF